MANTPPPPDNTLCVLKNVGTGTYINNGYGGKEDNNPLISWTDLVDGNGAVIGSHRVCLVCEIISCIWLTSYQFAYQWQSTDGSLFTLQSQFGQGLVRNNVQLDVNTNPST